jgi:hypothetical protein
VSDLRQASEHVSYEPYLWQFFKRDFLQKKFAHSQVGAYVGIEPAQAQSFCLALI